MLQHLRGFLATKLLPTTRCSVKFRAQLAMLSCARLWYKVICSSAIVEFHHIRENLPRKKRVLFYIVKITSPPPIPPQFEHVGPFSSMCTLQNQVMVLTTMVGVIKPNLDTFIR